MTAFERGIDCFFKNSSISNRSRNIAKNAQKVKNFTSVRGPPQGPGPLQLPGHLSYDKH